MPGAGRPLWLKALGVIGLLLVFLLGVKGMGDGFRLLGRDLLDSFFRVTENPFIALMVGIFSTTLVQSSSVTTSMVVGLVAAPENPLPLSNAVPMIMGANIGTTVTNTIVSLGHVARREEFRRAFAVAICHDFFNFMTVAILLPLELMTGLLQKSAVWFAEIGKGVSGYTYDSPMKIVLDACLGPIEQAGKILFDSPLMQGIWLIAVSAGMIILGLVLLVRLMRSAVQTRVEAFITGFLGRSALLSILVGAVVTVMVQSSSITTSLLVPLAAAGIVTLRQAFPVTLGANIGTTVTALLASLAASGVNAQAGVVIALVHFFFNLTGTLIVYPISAVRRIPLAASRWLAQVAVRSRRWALVYVIVLFYVLPALFAILK